VAHDLKQLAVKHVELLAQDPAISSGSTIAAKSGWSATAHGMVGTVKFEARTQRATQIVLDVERLGLRGVVSMAGIRLGSWKSARARLGRRERRQRSPYASRSVRRRRRAVVG
jgi:hypothetical protein